MGPVVAFVGATMRQVVRDRTALFFTVALPILLITILGITFGGGREAAVGVAGATSADGDRARSVSDRLGGDDRLSVVELADLDALRAAVRTERVDLGLVVGEDTSELGTLVLPTSTRGPAAQAVVADVLAGFDDEIPVEVVDEGRFGGNSDFALVSAQMIVLFAFITALTTSGVIVRGRDSGVLRRALSGPVSGAQLVAGLGATWFVIAAVQSLLILVVGALAFGVDWGAPLAVVALVVVFSAVGAAAGVLGGAAFASREQADSASAPVALVLAALGGCMVPAEIFPPVLDTISRFTPHRWALDGWLAVVFDGAGLADVAGELGVLVAFTIGLGAVAASLLRRRLIA